METKFQTSFIPKKPLSSGGGGAPHRRGSSLFMTLAVVLFVASLAAAGGAYLWQGILANQQGSYKNNLTQRENQFNIDLIEQLQQVNIKINLAKQILAAHLALSGIFDVIGRLTTEDVRFLNLDVTAPVAQSDGIKISMSGYGTSFSAVAFQSDVLSQLEQYGLRKIVKNPILSNPALNGNGTVSFGFSAEVDPSSLSYENSVQAAASSTAGSAAKASSPSGQ